MLLRTVYLPPPVWKEEEVEDPRDANQPLIKYRGNKLKVCLFIPVVHHSWTSSRPRKEWKLGEGTALMESLESLGDD